MPQICQRAHRATVICKRSKSFQKNLVVDARDITVALKLHGDVLKAMISGFRRSLANSTAKGISRETGTPILAYPAWTMVKK